MKIFTESDGIIFPVINSLNLKELEVKRSGFLLLIENSISGKLAVSALSTILIWENREFAFKKNIIQKEKQYFILC